MKTTYYGLLTEQGIMYLDPIQPSLDEHYAFLNKYDGVMFSSNLTDKNYRIVRDLMTKKKFKEAYLEMFHLGTKFSTYWITGIVVESKTDKLPYKKPRRRIDDFLEVRDKFFEINAKIRDSLD